MSEKRLSCGIIGAVEGVWEVYPPSFYGRFEEEKKPYKS